MYMIGMYLLGTFKVYGTRALGAHTEHLLSLVGSIAGLFNAGGRIAWGALGDRIGPVEALLVMSSIFSVIILTYPLSVPLGESAFALWTFLVFGCEGGNFALYMPGMSYYYLYIFIVYVVLIGMCIFICVYVYMYILQWLYKCLVLRTVRPTLL